MVPEKYEAVKKLLLRLGDCCAHKRLIFETSSKQIKTESGNGNLCLDRSEYPKMISPGGMFIQLKSHILFPSFISLKTSQAEFLVTLLIVFMFL